MSVVGRDSGHVEAGKGEFLEECGQQCQMLVEASGERQVWDWTIRQCYHLETVLGDGTGNQDVKKNAWESEVSEHNRGCMLRLGAVGLLSGIKEAWGSQGRAEAWSEDCCLDEELCRVVSANGGRYHLGSSWLPEPQGKPRPRLHDLPKPTQECPNPAVSQPPPREPEREATMERAGNIAALSLPLLIWASVQRYCPAVSRIKDSENVFNGST